MRTGTFLEEVACHRVVQARLHKLFPPQFNCNNSHVFRLIFTVVHNAWAFVEFSISISGINKQTILLTVCYRLESSRVSDRGKEEMMTIATQVILNDPNKIHNNKFCTTIFINSSFRLQYYEKPITSKQIEIAVVCI
jgi:hypothetical protein